MSVLEGEDVFTSKIDRISNSGNGIVVIDGNHINIGPIKREAVGKETKVKIHGGHLGICLYNSLRGDQYIRKHPATDLSKDDIIDLPEKDPLKGPHFDMGWKHLDYGEEYSTIIHHTSRSGDGILRITEENGYERSVNIGPVVDGAAGEQVTVKKLNNQFGVCLTESVRAENYALVAEIVGES